jgi:hypothetical protein
MKLSRFRTVLVATAVVCGSAPTGVGLGLFLTRVVLSHDRSAPATARPDRITAAGPQLRVRPLHAAAFGLAAGGEFPVIQVNSRSLPPKPPAFGHRNFKPIPTFNYQITADASLGGGPYTGTIIGSDPTLPGNKATIIPVPIIPLIITVNDATSMTSITYDPTINDSCVTGHTDLELVLNSPLFQNNHWTINGVDMGNTQYIEAFQRAQFLSLLKTPNYQLTFQPTVFPAQTLTFSGTNIIRTSNGYCADPKIGIIDVNELDNTLYNLMIGPLANTVNPATFPIFLMKNVVSAQGTDCCILGYHSAFASGLQVQIYSPFTFETAGLFRGPNGPLGPLYASVLSHELGEAVNDPTGLNPTPNWGNIGQVVGCQNNFEVGDPLSGMFMPPVVGRNGFSYKMQELAFISWFYGGTAPRGAGGVYSSNGTFQGIAILCPPGGTN